MVKAPQEKKSCALELTGRQLVFPKQPASLLYKIERAHTESPLVDQNGGKRSLALSIDYSCLDEGKNVVRPLLQRLTAAEVRDVVESAFIQALESSPHRSLSRFLLPTLLSRMQNSLTSDGYEAIGLCGEVPVPSFADMGWDEVLRALSLTQREAIGTWLREWHKVRDIHRRCRATIAKHCTGALDPGPSSEHCSQQEEKDRDTRGSTASPSRSHRGPATRWRGRPSEQRHCFGWPDDAWPTPHSSYTQLGRRENGLGSTARSPRVCL